MKRLMRCRAALAAAALATISSQPWGMPDPQWTIYARPHQLVSIGNDRRLNLFCLGSGSPTVILDGGLGSDITVWRKVHSALAKTTRVCAYDRAGVGFSDPGPLPRTAAALAADLDSLTRAAQLQPPYVLVASSLAGLHARLFADTHLPQIAGMVLVDPSFEHQVARYEAATPAYSAAAESQVAMLRGCAEALRDGRPAADSQAYKDCIGAPDADLPAQVNAALSARITSNSYRMVLSELQEFNGASGEQIDASRRSYGAMPLIVLTAGGIGTPDDDTVTRTRIWTEMHDRIAALSSHGTNRIVAGATHQIQLSRPEAVIGAVSEVVAAVRTRRP